MVTHDRLFRIIQYRIVYYKFRRHVYSLTVRSYQVLCKSASWLSTATDIMIPYA